jgi:hypothetical protein
MRTLIVKQIDAESIKSSGSSSSDFPACILKFPVLTDYRSPRYRTIAQVTAHYGEFTIFALREEILTAIII